MLKTILNLKDAPQLNKKEQFSINGGTRADQCFATVDSGNCASVSGIYRGFFKGNHRCLVTRVIDELGY